MVEGRIPVSVITGFLGSGKTTLLNHLVHHPDMGETAVIVNEFGEIGLDHELIEKSDENTILLGSGCLCCTVRGDLVDTLGDLSVRRLKGEVPPFNRVVIETTGLADPAPILHTLMSVPVVGRYKLDSVITTVDAVNGETTLSSHAEAIKQAAIADRLLITKTDLSQPGQAERLESRLQGLNPAAPALRVVNGQVEPSVLFGTLQFDPETKSEEVRDWLKAEFYDSPGVHDEHHENDLGHLAHPADAHGHASHDHTEHQHNVNRHDDKIAAFCLRFDQPMDWQTVALWLDSLVANHGEKLLRVKGLVDVSGIEEPVVLHAVQHLFHPPMRIKAWPESKRQSRIVFITSELTREDVEEALEKAKNIVQVRATP